MTAVRIAHAEPQPGMLGNGEFQTLGWLVVLADDAGQRAASLWLRDEPGSEDLAQLVKLAAQPAEEILTADTPEELIVRLLQAAGTAVTGVDIDVTGTDSAELSSESSVARLALGGPSGNSEVRAAVGLGLAIAAATGVPVRLTDEVMDRVAVPVPGDDLLAPLLDRVPPFVQVPSGGGLAGWPIGVLPGQRPRFAPRNLDFADGLDRWDLDHGSSREEDRSSPADYAATADAGAAVLSAAVPHPAGSAALVQALFADDYRGVTVAFRGEISTERFTEQAGLRLEILRHWWRTGRAPREDHAVTVTSGRNGWNELEVIARIPTDADIIRFGISLSGAGRVAARNLELRVVQP